ncbi:MAG: ThiF family adenylyltransferase [Candidatus Paceibacterota bacterium]
MSKILEPGTVYRLEAKTDASFYQERTDRNIGWITAAEQEMLSSAVVGIAGCGGMGGLVAATLVRLGIGEVRIADCEVFDISNINRQFGATRNSVGVSKAIATARMIRDITEDTTLVVYPEGINENSVDHFLQGCDIVCDEIEFWAIGARILLHQKAQDLMVPLMNCSTVGFGTRLFLFDHSGMNIGDMLGFSLTEAFELQDLISSKEATNEVIQSVLSSVLNALIPELPEYGHSEGPHRSRERCISRLRDECRAPIIATNPPLASGFVADQTLLYLLRKSTERRDVIRPPITPGYLYLDAGLMVAKSVTRMEVGNENTL